MAINRDKSRSKSKSPEVAPIWEAAAENEHDAGGENGGGGGDDVGDFVNDSEMAMSSSVPQQLERWTSSNSLTGQNK